MEECEKFASRDHHMIKENYVVCETEQEIYIILNLCDKDRPTLKELQNEIKRIENAKIDEAMENNDLLNSSRGNISTNEREREIWWPFLPPRELWNKTLSDDKEAKEAQRLRKQEGSQRKSQSSRKVKEI